MARLTQRTKGRRTRALLVGGLTAALATMVVAVGGIGHAAPNSPAQQQYKPVNTSPPTISGNAVENQTLTANPGRWNGNPNQFDYQWLRCNARGSGCANISGATAKTYRLTATDVGNAIRVVVTASNKEGATSASSAATAPVRASTGTSGGGGALPAGAVRLANGTVSIPASSVTAPERLIVDRIQYTPNRITAHGQTVNARFRVVDTRGFVVREALVYATGVPFRRLTAEPETRTGQDGWAQVNFRVLPTFSFRNTDLIVVFVRARKAGDSVLAGVSTRRLVSIRVGRS